MDEIYKMAFFHSLYRGVLVPGGFGVRGTEGKMLAINWARKQNKPYLGKTNVNLQSYVFIVLANKMMLKSSVC